MTWMIIPDKPFASGLLWAALLIAFLYFARTPVHTSLYRVSRLLISILRLQAKALARLIENVKQRNHDVLIETGKRQIERKLNRDFHRINEIVANDLGGYPALQKNISQLITELEEDYHKSAETPPPGPDWVEAIEAIVNIKEAQKGNPVIGKVLEDMCTSLENQQRKSLEHYRTNTALRHKLLHAMMPHWRKLNNTVERVGGAMKNLVLQAEYIDRHMNQFNEIQANTEKASRMLQVSALNGFLKSCLILACLIGCGYMNYHLIALPMSEMVGGGDLIGNSSMTLAQFSSIVIVLTEMAIGLFLMESLHITRLFPAVGSMDDSKRRVCIWTCFCLILGLALVQAGLAYLNDQSAANEAALIALLASHDPGIVSSSASISHIIPQAAQMLLGFFLPFVLIFIAIPFETFVESSRTILGALYVQLLHLLVIIMRMLATVLRYGCDILLALYDVVVCVPLWIESRLNHQAPEQSSEVSVVKDA